ncbi:MAG TPA: type I 3-dehydroquinate dehydratase [Holophagaceae bacterium]|nr:type I 3-dehydroquinate dehydratase [Holophagaceae bacterium]
MKPLPFFIVTLTHPTWEAARACARNLGEDALPELRLDLFPDEDPQELVQALGRRCLVSCRRESEGGRWPDHEEGLRLLRLMAAAQARPWWVDLEWELEVPPELRDLRGEVGLLRSVHVAPGLFDLESRLRELPEGDAYKWVGHAETLADNARLKPALAFARERGLRLSAFLMGAKGIPSRCLQRAWGGSFAYAAPDDAGAAAPGQVAVSTMSAWGCGRLTPATGLCGVIGSPVLHSKSPLFHNGRFRSEGQDLVYLPLDCGDAEEAFTALSALDLRGLSITAPLKESLPARLGFQGPLNTLWREGEAWRGANTDAEALAAALAPMPRGPVLLVGGGGVAATSRAVLEQGGWTVLPHSRRHPLDPEAIRAAAPVGVVQATSLGMKAGDPLPFPEALAAARPTLRFAVEWIYKERTAFEAWAEGLTLIRGGRLFELQAEAQSRIFGAGKPEAGSL